MALSLDGRSLRFSGPSLTVVNDLHGFPRYTRACPVRSFFSLVATDSWLSSVTIVPIDSLQISSQAVPLFEETFVKNLRRILRYLQCSATFDKYLGLILPDSKYDGDPCVYDRAKKLQIN